MLKKLVEQYPSLSDTIATTVVERHQLSLDDLPKSEDEEACRKFEGRLCRDYIMPRFSSDGLLYGTTEEENLRTAAAVLEEHHQETADNLAAAYLETEPDNEPDDAVGSDDLVGCTDHTFSLASPDSDDVGPDRPGYTICDDTSGRGVALALSPPSIYLGLQLWRHALETSLSARSVFIVVECTLDISCLIYSFKTRCR
jgi:hypothetical protein